MTAPLGSLSARALNAALRPWAAALGTSGEVTARARYARVLLLVHRRDAAERAVAHARAVLERIGGELADAAEGR